MRSLHLHLYDRHKGFYDDEDFADDDDDDEYGPSFLFTPRYWKVLPCIKEVVKDMSQVSEKELSYRE